MPSLNLHFMGIYLYKITNVIFFRPRFLVLFCFRYVYLKNQKKREILCAVSFPCDCRNSNEKQQYTKHVLLGRERGREREQQWTLDFLAQGLLPTFCSKVILADVSNSANDTLKKNPKQSCFGRSRVSAITC